MYCLYSLKPHNLFFEYWEFLNYNSQEILYLSFANFLKRNVNAIEKVIVSYFHDLD